MHVIFLVPVARVGFAQIFLSFRDGGRRAVQPTFGVPGLALILVNLSCSLVVT